MDNSKMTFKKPIPFTIAKKKKIIKNQVIQRDSRCVY